jgi:O-antigen biosynthesis protein
MIVRDAAGTLPACLAGIRPWVDELIVVDTGSLDSTKEIARDHGARLFDFPWCDDFSAARNESLRHAQGDWLFWMDADDTIDEVNGRKLRDLAAGEHPDQVLGYVLQVHCPGPRQHGANDATVVDHVKLVRRHPEIRFEFRIHEQLLPSIRRLGGEVAWTDVFVVHSGSDPSPAGRAKKYERDLRILEQELADRPDHPFALFNFGMTYSDMGEHARAAEYLERSLRHARPEETQVRKAYALLVHSHDQLGDTHRAAEICRQARELFPDDPELLFRQGKLAHDLGQLDEAVKAYRQLLEEEADRHFSSIDQGIRGYKVDLMFSASPWDVQGRLDPENTPNTPRKFPLSR